MPEAVFFDLDGTLADTAPDLAGIDCFAADATALPLTDSCLDLIVVAQALHWFEQASLQGNAQAQLRQFYRFFQAA